MFTLGEKMDLASGKICAILMLAVGVSGLRAQAPIGLSVVSATKSQVQRKWTPGDNASGYVVERKMLNGSYATAFRSGDRQPWIPD